MVGGWVCANYVRTHGSTYATCAPGKIALGPRAPRAQTAALGPMLRVTRLRAKGTVMHACSARSRLMRAHPCTQPAETHTLSASNGHIYVCVYAWSRVFGVLETHSSRSARVCKRDARLASSVLWAHVCVMCMVRRRTRGRAISVIWV